LSAKESLLACEEFGCDLSKAGPKQILPLLGGRRGDWAMDAAALGALSLLGKRGARILPKDGAKEPSPAAMGAALCWPKTLGFLLGLGADHSWSGSRGSLCSLECEASGS